MMNRGLSLYPTRFNQNSSHRDAVFATFAMDMHDNGPTIVPAALRWLASAAVARETTAPDHDSVMTDQAARI